MRFDPTKTGILLTLVVGVGAALLGVQEIVVGGVADSRINHLLRAPGNELGDALAGFAGALALVWLAVAVFLQRTELALQRQELSAQRKEWEKISRSLDYQAAIFKKEQEEREQISADRQLIALLDVFNERVTDYFSGAIFREIEIVDGKPRNHAGYTLSFSKSPQQAAFRKNIHALASLSHKPSGVCIDGTPDLGELGRIEHSLHQIWNLRNATTDAQRIFLGDLPILAALRTVDQLATKFPAEL